MVPFKEKSIKVWYFKAQSTFSGLRVWVTIPEGQTLLHAQQLKNTSNPEPPTLQKPTRLQLDREPYPKGTT